MIAPYRLHYAPDNASLIIRLALEELQLSYETVLVDRSLRAQKSSGYLALNPNGLIPVLETPDGPIFETGAILLWLADRHAGLAPVVDSVERGNFLKWLFFMSNTVHSEMRMIFYPELYIGDNLTDQAQLRAVMRRKIACHLDKFDALAATRPPWFAAQERSALDYYVAASLRWLALYPKGETGRFNIGKWPFLRDMAARLEYSAPVLAAIKIEGLGQTPFTAPTYAMPPEGSAT